jgi:uncharacterized membrane protein YvlD (DUF360 family)
VWITPDVHGNWLATLIGAVVLAIVSTLIAMAWEPKASTV